MQVDVVGRRAPSPAWRSAMAIAVSAPILRMRAEMPGIGVIHRHRKQGQFGVLPVSRKRAALPMLMPRRSRPKATAL